MNQRTIEAQNKLLNSANESNLIYQYLGGGERTTELKDEEESNKIEKVVKMFRKNIKLRNAMIQKNFWNRNYVNSGVTMIKITELIPEIKMSKDIIAWISSYVNNENCKEVLCGIKSEVDYNSYPYIEKYQQICDNNDEVNCLLNPQKIYDKPSINKLIYSLVENIYKKIKKLKKELSRSTAHYINSFITIQKSSSNENKCRLHTIIPNITFEFKQIQSLPLSRDIKLNKLLVSNKKSLRTKTGDELTNGFLTMSNDKSIVSLLDDTATPNSKNAKKIIFGIWLSIKQEDVSSYQSIADIIERNKQFLYRKCFDFLNISSKMETIYSPAPDEGVFLLALFLKGGYLFFEVRVLPNEEDKKFSISNSKYNLDTFTNQWLIIKRKFTIETNTTIDIDANYYKVNYAVNYINKLNGISNVSDNSKKLLKSVSSSNTVFTKLKAMSPNFDPMPELFEDSFSNGSDFFSNLKQSDTSVLTHREPIGPYNKSLISKKTKANSSGCNKFATFPFNIQPNNLNEKFTEKTQKPPISFPSSRNNNMLYNINPISSEVFAQSTANYSRTQQQVKMPTVHKKNLSFTNGKIAKNDNATQTELTGEQIENNIMNSSQINNLNSIISEQSNSITFLTEKVAKLEILFNQVVTVLKERNKLKEEKEKSLEKDLSEDDMDDQLSDSTDQKNEKSKETSLNIPQNQISILNASDSKSLPKILYSSTLLSNTINE